MNLLTDPIFRVLTDNGPECLNLPALMASLGRDEIHCLTGIQRYQEDAFHVFLCYLAGAILARFKDAVPIQEENYWKEGLLALAGDGKYDAWTLVVNDLSRPAFMQSPFPGNHIKPSRSAHTPDELDLLQTAKNHDVKQKRASHSEPDGWVYALVSLQTMNGFSGSGNYGISRMNSGYGNRSIVELVHNRSIGARWQEAIPRLLEHRREILTGPYGYDPKGLVLVWVKSWDGKNSLPLSKLDPFYVEICRRIRLQKRNHKIEAGIFTSKSERIDAKQLKGVVGDAWLPVELKTDDDGETLGVKALTFPPQGVHPEILRRLIFNEGLKLSPLQKPLETWEDRVWLKVSVLIRGQGKTDGFHERYVLIPGHVRRRIFGPLPQIEPFAALSRSAIECAGQMQNRVLKPAVFTYLEGAPERIQFDRDSAQAWWTRFSWRFETLWSDDYFPWLWSVPESFDQFDELKKWIITLRDHALTVLRETGEAMPIHTGRRYRTIIGAERRFWGAFYSKDNFSFLKEGG